ncbi:MAG: hypothetical protein ACK55I_17975, partial [bacterium]
LVPALDRLLGREDFLVVVVDQEVDDGREGGAARQVDEDQVRRGRALADEARNVQRVRSGLVLDAVHVTHAVAVDVRRGAGGAHGREGVGLDLVVAARAAVVDEGGADQVVEGHGARRVLGEHVAVAGDHVGVVALRADRQRVVRGQVARTVELEAVVAVDVHVLDRDRVGGAGVRDGEEG